jgi:hypothetical protein
MTLRDNNNPQHPEHKSSRLRLLIVLLIILLLVAILLLLRTCAPPSAGIGNLEIDPGAQEYQASAGVGGFGESIAIPGFDQIPMQAGSTTSRLNLYNPGDNPCYFSFQIILDSTGETLYRSGLVAPGSAVTTQEFSHALAAGNYDAHIAVSTYALADKSPMNGANVQTVIVVS